MCPHHNDLHHKRLWLTSQTTNSGTLNSKLPKSLLFVCMFSQEICLHISQLELFVLESMLTVLYLFTFIQQSVKFCRCWCQWGNTKKTCFGCYCAKNKRAKRFHLTWEKKYCQRYFHQLENGSTLFIKNSCLASILKTNMYFDGFSCITVWRPVASYKIISWSLQPKQSCSINVKLPDNGMLRVCKSCPNIWLIGAVFETPISGAMHLRNASNVPCGPS